MLAEINSTHVWLKTVYSF